MMIMDVRHESFCFFFLLSLSLYLFCLITNFLLGKLPNKPLHNKGLGGGQVVGELLWGEGEVFQFCYLLRFDFV
jgi:hypothetical protein